MAVGLTFLNCAKAFRAFVFQFSHNDLGHGQMFLFEEKRDYFWYYFFAAIGV